MPEPVTCAVMAISGWAWMADKAALVGGTVMGGPIGGTTDRRLAAVLRGARDRVAGLRGLPENHDVARAIRVLGGHLKSGH